MSRERERLLDSECCQKVPLHQPFRLESITVSTVVLIKDDLHNMRLLYASGLLWKEVHLYMKQNESSEGGWQGRIRAGKGGV